MKYKYLIAALIIVVYCLAATKRAVADDGKYGWFELLDHRSVFGTGFFPEPFLVDEGDKDREAEFKWLHQEGVGTVSDQLTAEVEWGFGDTTVEVEVPWETDASAGTDSFTGLPDHERTSGMDGIQIAVRHPVWQFVSSDDKVDNTVVAAFEVAAPTNSPVSKDTELVPGIFDLLRIGDHLGFQTHIGWSTQLGADPRDKQTLEYSLDVSYLIDNSIAHLPNELLGIVPMVEIAGERGLNNGDLSDDLSGVVGAKINLGPIGEFSPRVGIGCVLPIDKQAKENFHWGIITNIVFDF